MMRVKMGHGSGTRVAPAFIVLTASFALTLVACKPSPEGARVVEKGAGEIAQKVAREPAVRAALAHLTQLWDSVIEARVSRVPGHLTAAEATTDTKALISELDHVATEGSVAGEHPRPLDATEHCYRTCLRENGIEVLEAHM